MFDAAKNYVASQAARKYVENLLARYGKLHDLKIDAKQRTVRLECMLHGEPQPMVVIVEEYNLENREGRHFARVVRCTCSRAWAQNLAEDFVIGREIEIPVWAAGMFR